MKKIVMAVALSLTLMVTGWATEGATQSSTQGASSFVPAPIPSSLPLAPQALLAETLGTVAWGESSVDSPNLLHERGWSQHSRTFDYEPGPEGPEIMELGQALQKLSLLFRVSSPETAVLTFSQALYTPWFNSENGSRVAYSLFGGTRTQRLEKGIDGWRVPEWFINLKWHRAAFRLTNAVSGYAQVEIPGRTSAFVPITVIDGVVLYPPELSTVQGTVTFEFKVSPTGTREYRYSLATGRVHSEATLSAGPYGFCENFWHLGGETNISPRIGERHADFLFLSEYKKDQVAKVSPAIGTYDSNGQVVWSREFWYRNAKGGPFQKVEITGGSALIPFPAGRYQWFFRFPAEFGAKYRQQFSPPPQVDDGKG